MLQHLHGMQMKEDKVEKIVINGRIPSKKNSRNQIQLPNGRRINIPSKEYKKWHKNASRQLDEQGVERRSEGSYGVIIKFWMPDNRTADLTNKAESIMDLLVDNHILEDDCWQNVPFIILECMGIDRINPRAEVEVPFDLHGLRNKIRSIQF